MKTFRGQVVMSYWQEIEVEAETKEEAEMMMYERFDIGKAGQGEGDVFDIEVVKE